MRLLLFACLLTCSSFVFADIIPDNSHYVDRCVKIVNMDRFPDIAIIGSFKFYWEEVNYYDTISNSLCIEPNGYDFHSLQLYGVNRSVIAGHELSDFDISQDKRFVPCLESLFPDNVYINDSIPYESVTEEYRILGFSEFMVLIYKHKEIIGFNNGQPDSITYFTYQQDSTWLLPSIPTGIAIEKQEMGIEFYPNPASEALNIYIQNTYEGLVLSRLYAQNGQLVLSQQAIKSGDIFNNVFNTSTLIQGVYYLELTFGDNSYTEKIVIK